MSAVAALRSPRNAPWLAALLLTALYLPSLGFGYKADDFRLLSVDWGGWLANPFELHGRPFWTLSYVLLNAISDASVFHHAVNLALFLGVLAAGLAVAARRGLPPVAGLFVVAALCHPAFLWTVTWIAQRNDLLLLLFLCLAVLSLESRWSLVFLLIGSGAKTPFVFQNLSFAARHWNDGRPLRALFCAALVPVFLYAGYATYYAHELGAGAHGLYLLEGSGPAQLALVALFRSLKIAEGLFYTFVPVSAFAVSPAAVLCFGLVYAAGWAAVLLGIRSLGVRGSDLWANRELRLLGSIGLLLAVGYAFSSGLRIYVPATLFLYLAVVATLRGLEVRGRGGRLVVAGIVVVGVANALGVLLNYEANRTGCFVLERRVETACGGRPVPAEDWSRMRSELVDAFVRDRLNREARAPRAGV